MGAFMEWVLFSMQGAAVTVISYFLIFALVRSVIKPKS